MRLSRFCAILHSYLPALSFFPSSSYAWALAENFDDKYWCRSYLWTRWMQDLEFVVTNKVNRIINCAGKQIPNHWETVGVQYMTFYWLENDKQVPECFAIHLCLSLSPLSPGVSLEIKKKKTHKIKHISHCKWKVPSTATCAAPIYAGISRERGDPLMRLNLTQHHFHTCHALSVFTQIIFDHKDEVMNNTYKFIEEALLVGDSVLVHSVRGHNRSVCIISAYLMRK